MIQERVEVAVQAFARPEIVEARNGLHRPALGRDEQEVLPVRGCQRNRLHHFITNILVDLDTVGLRGRAPACFDSLVQVWIGIAKSVLRRRMHVEVQEAVRSAVKEAVKDVVNDLVKDAVSGGG